MNNGSFVFYESFREATKDLPDESRLSIYDALMDYALYGIEPTTDDAVALGFFKLIKPQIDANMRKRVNGKSGGRPVQTEPETEPNANQTITKAEPNHNQSITKAKPNHNQSITKAEPNVNVNVNANVNAIYPPISPQGEESADLGLDEKVVQGIEEFKAFRKKIKKPMTDRAVELLASKLKKLSSKPEEQLEILNRSIMQGWTGIYPLENAITKNNKANLGKAHNHKSRTYTAQDLANIGLKLLEDD